MRPACAPSELAYFSKHGKPIWSEPRGLEAGYNWPQFSIHRGTLQQILLDAATERLGADNILTSHHLSGLDRDRERRSRRFHRQGDRQTARAATTATLLIAADGIHSAVREKLYPSEGPPIWNGRILWRGITAADAFLTGRTMIMAGHEILKFVCYPISKAAGRVRQVQINWVAERHMPPTYQWRREDYNRTAQARGIPAVVRGLEVRLARRARPDPQLRRMLTNIRWSTAIRLRAGPSAASR